MPSEEKTSKNQIPRTKRHIILVLVNPGRGRTGSGHLCAGGDPLRVVDGAAAVSCRDCGGNGAASHLPGAGAAVRDPLLGATADELPRLARIIFVAVASHRVGDRPNRCEPRAIKRRPKQYARLKKPRAELRAALLAGPA